MQWVPSEQAMEFWLSKVFEHKCLFLNTLQEFHSFLDLRRSGCSKRW